MKSLIFGRYSLAVTERRRTGEKVIVGLVSVTIAVIFVVATKPWKANLPRDHKPTHTTTQSATTH